MKGKQRWHTTAATSPSALELLAEWEDDDLETKVRFKAPKGYKSASYRPWEDPRDAEEHSRKVRERGLAEMSKHDLYVAEIAEHVEQNVKFIEVARHETFHRNNEEGEFDILARTRTGIHTYFEIKSTYCDKQVENAYAQFVRAINAFPKRQWNFILCTPLENNEYYLEDCTKEAYRRHKMNKIEQRTKRD